MGQGQALAHNLSYDPAIGGHSFLVKLNRQSQNL